ncbi:MAG: type I methionyl aminopeptidase [Phycisphaeraceae bacterium]|nr:type I methionyl aminopeptidase [Phycisphaeraceae bacterium]
MGIVLKTAQEIEKMRAAGRVVKQVLDHCKSICQPGITTRQIDLKALELISAAGAEGLFKNYPTYQPGEGFPGNVCISINQEVVHGIASDRVIRDGDIVSIDCGVRMDGWCGDSAVTLEVGKVPPQTHQLCQVTEHLLRIAVENVQPGRRWSQIARLMQNYAEQAGFSVVREYVGHGIGRKLHEDPKVPNYVSPELIRQDIVLREGMVLAIEPMCNQGSAQVIEMEDGWTVCTVDRQPSAHFEHTVAVTSRGADVLTDGR